MKLVANEKGSVMLFTMMLILIVTVMGLIATQTSVFEIKITENNRRFYEEFAAAESGLNNAMAGFGVLSDETETNEEINDEGEAEEVEIAYSLNTVLNEAINANFKTAIYKSKVIDSLTNNPIATIEIRRIVNLSDHKDVSGLSDQANNVPKQSHRYYGGSIDWRRFAITSTALKRGGQSESEVWVQKGILMPAKQDADIF